jgi:hypothetical protein
MVWNSLSPNMCWLIDVKNTMIYHGYVMAFKYRDIQILWCQTGPKKELSLARKSDLNSNSWHN